MKLHLEILFVLLLTACAGGASDVKTPGPVVPIHTALTNTQWRLTDLNGQKPLAGTTITLAFSETTLSGSDGCNMYGGGSDSGPYLATVDGTITISQTAVTAMQCLGPAGITEQETAYMAALHQAATYKVSNGELVIVNSTGKTLLVFQSDNHS